VPAIAPGDCDWRVARDYAWLIDAGRPVFAWEWLRRSLAYRSAWARGGDAGDFGPVRLEDPALCGLQARPVWSRSAMPSVLRCAVVPMGDDVFDLRRMADLATVVVGQGDVAEHLLLSDGLRVLRLDLVAGSFGAGPMGLRWTLDGVAALAPVLLALRQFVAVSKGGRFSVALHPREARAGRWILMLRVADALASGASQREIAGELFGEGVAGARWRVAAPSWRLRVQRLVAAARRCQGMTPRDWLG
jgi:hypothetical protein